jgi:hypothetical protein
MKLPTSDKVSSYGIKPHIKKGYYPAKLLKVEPYMDMETEVAKECKFGRQLIFEFAIYRADNETGAPTEPMTYISDPELQTKAQVVIPKFLYHEYKVNGKDKKWTGQYGTAITPKSNITKVLKALGWEFSTEPVDTDLLIGHWVEANIDDYEYESADGTKVLASSVKDINPYTGPTANPTKEVSKPKVENPQLLQELQDKLKKIESVHNDGFLTDDGYKQAKEQIETQIEALK